MARSNVLTRAPAPVTHEGGKAARINSEQALRRSVMSCLLWEDGFYESGVKVADRIADLVTEVKPEKVAEIAIQAREQYKLRHVPLWLVRSLAVRRYNVASVLERVIQRPDELGEFLALYWKDGRKPVPASAKRGLAAAFRKFDAYQLSKWDRKSDSVKLRDVLRLVHPKPLTEEQAQLWKGVIDDSLESPDTWEVALSSGADKASTWNRLLDENKLGGLALLRNLRNMTQAGVDQGKIELALAKMRTDRILPYRFIAAAKAAPRLERSLEQALLGCLKSQERLAGETWLFVDVSGSMDYGLSSKSDLNRIDAACGLAMLLSGVADRLRVVTFSEKAVEVPPRQGFALRDAIAKSQPHSGTRLKAALEAYRSQIPAEARVIVITDEQSHDGIAHKVGADGRRYVINVASNQNGVGYGDWTHIDGFSEAVVDYIREFEASSL